MSFRIRKFRILVRSMEEIEIGTEPVNPLTHVKPYFSSMSDSEISILIGSILFFKDVKLKLLQELLNMKRLEVEEQIGRLLQSNLVQEIGRAHV